MVWKLDPYGPSQRATKNTNVGHFTNGLLLAINRLELK